MSVRKVTRGKILLLKIEKPINSLHSELKLHLDAPYSHMVGHVL